MNAETNGRLSPDECMGHIFELSGVEYPPEIAADLWPKVLNHKWR